MTFPNDYFKDVMSTIPSCVGIVWVKVNETQTLGCTISSFISISVALGDEKVCFILKNNSRTGELIESSKTFNISILGEKQSEIAKLFAAGISPNEIDLFLKKQTDWESHTICNLVLEYNKKYVENFSTIYIANVISSKPIAGIDPLIYRNRKFYSDLFKH